MFSPSKRDAQRTDEIIDMLDNGDLTPSDTDAVAYLAELTPMEFDRVCVKEAKKLGVLAETLKSEVKKRRRGSADDIRGRVMELPEPEPWPDAVEGGALLTSLSAVVSEHMVLPPGAADAVALWVLHAHTHDSSGISPLLAVTSPTPECGKSTLLTLLGELVPRPLPASNITAAALFRAVEQWRPCVLVDEADTFLKQSDELRGVINSGHSKATAYVVRTTGDDHEPRQFRTWAPKVIAAIGTLSPTLASRSIAIELRRMAPGESVNPLRGDRLEHLEPYARKAARWAQDNISELRDSDPAIPESLRGRTADNWRHLFAIADLAQGEWPRLAREAAETLGAKGSAVTPPIMLLEDIRRVFADKAKTRGDVVKFLSSTELAEALVDFEDRPWPEWGRTQKPVSSAQIARLLKPFNIKPVKTRVDGYTAGTRGYTLEKLSDAFARYLPQAPGATPPQVNGGAGFGDFEVPQPNPAVALTIPVKPSGVAGCGGVAPGNSEERL